MLPVSALQGGAGSTAEVTKQIKSLVLQWTQEGGPEGASAATSASAMQGGTSAQAGIEVGTSAEPGKDASLGGSGEDALPSPLAPAHGECGDEGCEIKWD